MPSALIPSPERVIRSLGAGARYLGFRYFVASVELYRQAPERVSLTKEIYPAVARQFKTSQYNVERDLRTYCNAVWNHGDRARLNQLAGYRLVQKPTTGELIDIIAAYLDDQQEE